MPAGEMMGTEEKKLVTEVHSEGQLKAVVQELGSSGITFRPE